MKPLPTGGSELAIQCGLPKIATFGRFRKISIALPDEMAIAVDNIPIEIDGCSIRIMID